MKTLLLDNLLFISKKKAYEVLHIVKRENRNELKKEYEIPNNYKH